MLLTLCGHVSAQVLVLEHATVIDMTGAKPHKNFSVAIEGDRILDVRKKIKTPPRGATIIGRPRQNFLIPGRLWDMHMHPGNAGDLLSAAGVSRNHRRARDGSRGSLCRSCKQWRARPDVPRIVTSGFLDGPLMLSAGPLPPGAVAVATADQARFAVRFLAQSGYDFIKVYNDLPREAYFAIAEESRSLGIPFAGHVPEAVSPAEASEAGQRSQEHLINILLACSTNEDALREDRIRVMNSERISPEERLRLLGFPIPEGLFDTYSEDKAAALFRTFVRNGTWHTPTLALLHGFAYGDADDLRKREYLRDLTDQQFEALVERIRALLDRHKKLVGDMHRAGVEFLAGTTDTSLNNPVIPGAGLHLELALLVESGFTPLEALATATRNPARYFGLLNQMGTIEAGKAADLVLLDADPLADIHNTEKIRAVVMRGRYFPRAPD